MKATITSKIETMHLRVPKSLKNFSFSSGTSGNDSQKSPTKNWRMKAREPATRKAEITLPIYFR